MIKLPILFTTIILVSLCLSCSNNNITNSNSTPVSGNKYVTTINTKEEIGFSFSQGKLLSPPYDPTNYPDFEANTSTNEIGNIVGGYFLSINPDQSIRQAFALVHAATSQMDADAFFDSLTTVSADNFQWVAHPLLKNQIWIVKTINQNFAKILILDNSVIGSNPDGYAEVKFEWVFQSDGSINF